MRVVKLGAILGQAARQALSYGSADADERQLRRKCEAVAVDSPCSSEAWVGWLRMTALATGVGAHKSLTGKVTETHRMASIANTA